MVSPGAEKVLIAEVTNDNIFARFNFEKKLMMEVRMSELGSVDKGVVSF